MQSTRSPRTRQILAAAGIVLAGLSLGTGAAGAFPNGPVVISDDPIPPLPPQTPDDIADAPDQPDQPWQGPDQWANPEPGPVQPIPGPGPQQGGGQQGGGTGGEQAGAPAGPTAEDFAAIAQQLDAATEAETAEAEVQPDGTVGKESDRPDTTDVEDTDELAAGELTADQAQSGPWALFAALGAMVLAAIAGLFLFLARRNRDEQEAMQA